MKNYTGMTEKELLKEAYWFVQHYEYLAAKCLDAHQRDDHNHPGQCYGNDVEDNLHDASTLCHAIATKLHN